MIIALYNNAQEDHRNDPYYTAIVFVLYTLLMVQVSKWSAWAAAGLYAATMLLLILGKTYLWGYHGGSDAMGNGMKREFLSITYLMGMVLTTVSLLIRWWMARNNYEIREGHASL